MSAKRNVMGGSQRRQRSGPESARRGSVEPRLTLAAMGEDAVVESLVKAWPQCGGIHPQVVCGVGDDCAVVDVGLADRYQLLKVDAIVEDVHFLMTAAPRAVGWKAACRAVSDMAAMGGSPSTAQVTLTVRRDLDFGWLSGVYDGFAAAAERYCFAWVGGETTRGPSPESPVVISVSMQGWVLKDQLTLRSGARPGDAVCVTGVLGGSIRGWHLRFTPRVAEAAWLTTFASPTAMMDLSDGLATDFPRLARRSGVAPAFRPAAPLPRRPGVSPVQAACDGEDYELLVTLPPEKLQSTLAAWKLVFPRVRLTHIGWVMTLEESSSLSPARAPQGWDHFSP